MTPTWEDQSLCLRAGLPFGAALTGGDLHEIQQGQKQSPASGKEDPLTSIQAGERPSEELLWLEKSFGSLAGQ